MRLGGAVRQKALLLGVGFIYLSGLVASSFAFTTISPFAETVYAQSSGSGYSDVCQSDSIILDRPGTTLASMNWGTALPLNATGSFYNYRNTSTQLDGNLYRSPSGLNQYTLVQTVRLTFQKDSANRDVAAGTFTDTPTDVGKYTYFVATSQVGNNNRLVVDCTVESPELELAAGPGGILGVTATADPCSNLSNIGSLLSGGIGALFVKMVTCVIKYLVQNTETDLMKYLCGSSKISQTPSFISRAHAQGSFKYTPNCPEGEAEIGVGNKIGDFESELKNPDSTIRQLWKFSIGFINVIVILALLAIAFANILHLNINTYAAKKALPGLVLGVIGANASLLLIRFLADVTSAVSVWMADIGTTGGGTITTLIAIDFPLAIGRSLIVSAWAAILTGPFTGGLSAPIFIIVAIVLVLYYFFLVIAFIFSLLKRIIFLYFLTAVAPLAFLAYGIPNFQQYFFKWWDFFVRNLFLFPVILFGMAMTVKIADAVGTTRLVDPLVLTSPAKFIGILMILFAATMVLKLPKLITKGAIDTLEGFKRAIGMAPLAATAVSKGYDWNRGRVNQRFESQINSKVLEAQALRRAGDRAGARRAIAEGKDIRGRRIIYEAKSKTRSDNLKSFRGFATAFGRPELAQQAWQARSERFQKDRYIDAMTKTHGLYGRIRGVDAEAELAKKLADDELKDARTMGDIQDWLNTLGGGHWTRKGTEIRDAIEEVAGNDYGKVEELRQKVANLKSAEEIRGFISKSRAEGGLGVSVSTIRDYHDVMKIAGLEKAVTRVARGVREGEEQYDPFIKMATKRSVVDNRYKKVPGTGGGAGGGGGTGPFGDAGDSGNNPPPGGSGPRPTTDPSNSGGNATRVFVAGGSIDVRNMPELRNITADEISRLQQHSQMLHDTLDKGEIDRLGSMLHNIGEDSSAETLDEARRLIASMVDTNKAGSSEFLASLKDMAGEALKQSADYTHLVASGDRSPDAIAQRYLDAQNGSLSIEAVNREISAKFDAASLSKLVDALNSNQEEGTAQLKAVLGDSQDKLAALFNKTLSNSEKDRAILSALNDIREASSGRSNRSVRSAIDQLGSRLAKEMGLTQLSSSRMIMDAVTSQPAQNVVIQPPDQNPPTNPDSAGGS